VDNFEQELEIDYIYDYKEFKETNLHPTSIASILCCNVIPIAGILFFELILLIVCLTSGFSEIRVYSMILIPSIYGAIVLLYTPSYLILLKIQWKRLSKLPLERKWIFTNEGIIVDKTYIRTLHRWAIIQKVVEGKKTIQFRITDNKTFNLTFDLIPKRALSVEQYELLQTILLKYLDSNKIQFKIDKQVV